MIVSAENGRAPRSPARRLPHWVRLRPSRRSPVIAGSGRHRAVGIADLLTAVLAAVGVTVLHYDSDFEIAAEVLDFQHRWVLTRGTV